jgi:hypothetical protein
LLSHRILDGSDIIAQPSMFDPVHMWREPFMSLHLPPLLRLNLALSPSCDLVCRLHIPLDSSSLSVVPSQGQDRKGVPWTYSHWNHGPYHKVSHAPPPPYPASCG